MAEIRAAAHAAARAMVTLLLPRHDLQRRVHAAQEALQREFSEAEAEAAAANERLTAMEMHSKAVALEELAADRSGEEAARRATDLALEAETASEKAKLAEQEAERMEAAAEAAEQKLAEQTEGACVYGSVSFCSRVTTRENHQNLTFTALSVHSVQSPSSPIGGRPPSTYDSTTYDASGARPRSVAAGTSCRLQLAASSINEQAARTTVASTSAGPGASSAASTSASAATSGGVGGGAGGRRSTCGTASRTAPAGRRAHQFMRSV